MDPDAVRDLYDQATADTYDERWHGVRWGNDTFHLAKAIAPHIEENTRWLDIGCGTGKILSMHPGVERAGLDLSPSMLDHARRANPDANFYEADFREDIAEFHDAWTLVSCTGEPYSYVDVLPEIETMVEMMSRWTSPDGKCFLMVHDVTDLTGQHLPYHISGEPGFPGLITLKAVVWSLVDWSDPNRPRDHEFLIWPTLEHWIATYSRFFGTIVIETLPHDPEWLPTPRRVLIASDKRTPEDDTPARVTFLHPPINSVDVPNEAPPRPTPLRDVTLGELLDRARPWDRSFWRSVSRRVRTRR